jgi:hypothetical protein
VHPGPTLAGGLLVGWTLFVWVGRIRNALADATLGAGAKAGAVALATSFVLLAAVVGVLLVLGRPSRGATAAGARRWLRPAVLVLAAWTTLVWVVKVPSIALSGDWSVGFVVVHTVLGVVSIVLAALAARAVVAAAASPRPGDGVAPVTGAA